nr:helix-turn-helix transcriptional regulator [uncultured Agathobaculum sp.]
MSDTKAIQAKREAIGATQQAMADSLGVDRSTVAKWEVEGAYPRPRLLPLIASFLGCTVDDLYADEPTQIAI